MKTLMREAGLPAETLRGPSSTEEGASVKRHVTLDARESDSAEGLPRQNAPTSVSRNQKTIIEGFIDASDSTLRREPGPSISLLAAVQQAAYMREEMEAILEKRSAKGEDLRDAIRIGLAAIGLLQGASIVMAKREREAA